MQNDIRIVHHLRKTSDAPHAFGTSKAEAVLRFHKSFPEYDPTPLVSLAHLAEYTGVNSICVKDESKRFGLNAFKALGGSYAIGRCMAQRLGIDPGAMDYAKLVSAENRQELGELTFITATDGNHGRGVAWTARQIGQKCIVYMPHGTAQERLDNIRKLGATASIIDGNYDDAVRRAAGEAGENGWVLVQDTAWEGYTQIPEWIMQGYTTMGCEISRQIPEKPTHIFLQAGVGSMAGAMAAFFADLYKDDPEKPLVTVVEPHKANCVFQTAEAGDGTIRCVGGAMDTIMAGLACGEPCTLAWEMLDRYADFFVSMPDWVAANGMRILANPLNGDPAVVSGESGASAFGLAMTALRDPDMREKLLLNKNSRILCISTEGATDRENYRRILWDGAYPAE